MIVGVVFEKNGKVSIFGPWANLGPQAKDMIETDASSIDVVVVKYKNYKNRRS